MTQPTTELGLENLIDAEEELAIWARDYLDYQFQQIGIAPGSVEATFLRDGATFEVEVRHDLLAAALVAIGLPNQDGANLHKAHEEHDAKKHANAVTKLQKYSLTVDGASLKLTNHSGDVFCETTLPLERASLRDPSASHSFSLHQISLGGLSGIHEISAVNGKITPKAARLYKDAPPIRLRYFAESQSAEVVVGSGSYQIKTMPAGDAPPHLAAAGSSANRPFDPQHFARAFRALRACMGPKRESADQTVWYEGASAVTADRAVAGRFQAKADIAPEPMGVERVHLDALATVFANRFKGTPTCFVSTDRLIVSDSVLTCSCPIVTNSSGRAEYPYDDRENARAYRVNRMPLVLEAGFLRAVSRDLDCKFVDLTPLDDVQAALADETLQVDLSGGRLHVTNIREPRLLMSTRSGPSVGNALIEMRPIGEPSTPTILTRRVDISRLIATSAVHSDPYVEYHFLDKWLTIVSQRDDETCTFLLSYIRAV